MTGTVSTLPNSTDSEGKNGSVTLSAEWQPVVQAKDRFEVFAGLEFSDSGL